MRTLAPTVKSGRFRAADAPPKTVDAFYLSAEWKALRAACLKRDRYRCVICGEPAIVADHVLGRRAGGRDELGNLRSLCRLHDNRFKETSAGDRRADPSRWGGV